MKLSVREIAVFGMLGALMYASKVLMEALPNVHLLGVFVVALTVVYRKKALYPIYTYVLINGLMAGFALWWLPYLNLLPCCGRAAMLLPPGRSASGRRCNAVYQVAETVRFPSRPPAPDAGGLLTISWILAGLPWDGPVYKQKIQRAVKCTACQSDFLFA